MLASCQSVLCGDGGTGVGEGSGREGFGGDAGFAQAQVCLMEHAHDAVVTASVAAATTSLYARAGINLQETFRQATGASSLTRRRRGGRGRGALAVPAPRAIIGLFFYSCPPDPCPEPSF